MLNKEDALKEPKRFWFKVGDLVQFSDFEIYPTSGVPAWGKMEVKEIRKLSDGEVWVTLTYSHTELEGKVQELQAPVGYIAKPLGWEDHYEMAPDQHEKVMLWMKENQGVRVLVGSAFDSSYLGQIWFVPFTCHSLPHWSATPVEVITSMEEARKAFIAVQEVQVTPKRKVRKVKK